VNAFQSSITGNLSPYILSDFSEAPLVTVISTVSSALSGALLMPIARMLNVWDRGNGLIVMASIATLGLILSAACTNIYSYASAQIFYSVGFTGLIFCVDVFTIDTSTLRDRGLAYAFTSSPYIISAFAGPKAAEDFNNSNWRWGYGAFAIILPIVCIPLWSSLFYNKRKAKANGFLQTQNNRDKTAIEWIKWFVIEFDCKCKIVSRFIQIAYIYPLFQWPV
jgi:MFS family permease